MVNITAQPHILSSVNQIHRVGVLVWAGITITPMFYRAQ